MKEKKIYASENFDEEIKKIIEKEFGVLNSNKVILLEKNLKHIEERHPEVIEILKNSFSEMIKNTDYILKDNKKEDSIWFAKEIKSKNNLLVIKLSIKKKKEHQKYINSIITSYSLKEKRFNSHLKSKKILYKRLKKDV